MTNELVHEMVCAPSRPVHTIADHRRWQAVAAIVAAAIRRVVSATACLPRVERRRKSGCGRNESRLRWFHCSRQLKVKAAGLQATATATAGEQIVPIDVPASSHSGRSW